MGILVVKTPKPKNLRNLEKCFASFHAKFGKTPWKTAKCHENSLYRIAWCVDNKWFHKLTTPKSQPHFFPLPVVDTVDSWLSLNGHLSFDTSVVLSMLRIVAFFEAVMGVIYEKSHQVRGRYRPQKSKLQVPTCSKVTKSKTKYSTINLNSYLVNSNSWEGGRVEAMAWGRGLPCGASLSVTNSRS